MPHVNLRFLDTRRPLVYTALAFWGGVLLAGQGPLGVVPLLLILVACIALSSTKLIRNRFAHLNLFLVFTLCGVTIWAVHRPQSESDPVQLLLLENPPNPVVTLRGTVSKPDVFLSEDDYSQFILNVDEAEVASQHWQVSGRVLVRWTSPDRPLIHGERVAVRGVAQPAIHRVNHGVRGVEHHYRLEHVHSSMRARNATAVSTLADAPILSFRAMAGRLRQDLAERMSGAVHANALPFTLTVWLGDRHRISNDEYERFLESGTAHILAVSGVHIGLIYVSLTYGMRLLIRRNRLRIVLTLTVIFLFAFVAGARISSLRAAIMIGLYLSAEWFEREPDAPTALSLAAIVFGLQNPNVIFMPGFQLSFLSIASLLLFRAPLLDRLPGAWPLWIREGVASVISVQILSLPAAISAFHVVPVLGVVANLLILPLLSVVLWIAALTSLMVYLAPPAALWFGHALRPVVWVIDSLANAIASLPMSHFYLSPPTPVGLLGYGVAVFGLIAFVYGRQDRAQGKWAMGVGVVVAVLFWHPWTNSPSITFLDVGHGDAAVIRTSSGDAWVIDGGVRDEFRDMGKQVVAPYLFAHHLRTLEGVIATHADLDHVGGLRRVIKLFTVRRLYVPPGFEEHEFGAELLGLCAAHDVEVVVLKLGDRIVADDFELAVLHPDPVRDAALSTNNRSLVFTVSTSGMRALFTGDIEAEAERRFSGPVQVDVIKVPHHGSVTSSTDPFLDQITANIAVVSTGLRGDDTITSDEVMRRYQTRTEHRFRTDYLGSVRIEAGKDGLRVTHARELNGIAFRSVE